MKKLVSLTTIICFISIANAQENDQINDRFLPEYTSFSLFNLSLGLNLDFPTTLTKGGVGGSMEIGLNLARPFTKNTLIAPYVGFGVMSIGSYKNDFIQQLKDDFAGFPQEYTDLRSLDASTLSNEQRGRLESYELAADEYNHITNNNIKTKLSFQYGLMLKLPYKYIPLIKFYKSKHFISGTKQARPVGFIIYNPSSTDPFSDSAGEIQIDGSGFEIDLFTGWFASTGKHSGNVQLAQISLYAEWYSLSSLKIGEKNEFLDFSTEKIPLRTFFGSSESFSKNYKNEFRMGIKIGISLL